MTWTYLSKGKRPKDPRRIIVERQRYGPDWKEQKRACLERDGHRCVKCGSQRGIAVHHKRKIRFFVVNNVFLHKEANDLSNLEALCETCHPAADGHSNPGNWPRLK